MVRTKSGHLCHGQTNQKLSEYHTFELCVLCSILLNVISTVMMTLVQWPFSRTTWMREYHNVSILDFIGAKDDGGSGNNWSYKTCKSKLQSNRHQQINK